MPARWQPRRPVVLVVDSDEFGGAEVYVDLLLRHLPAHIPRVLAARSPALAPLVQAAEASGADVVTWSRRPSGLAALEGIVRRSGLLHLNMPWPGANREAAVLSTCTRSPAIATVHLYLSPRTDLRRRALRLVYGRFSRIIAVSRPIHRAVVSDLGVAPGIVRLVQNGVEERDVTEVPQARAGEPVIRIGAIGRLTTQKGFDVLIAATEILVQRGARIEVCIAGQGPELAVLERTAGHLPVRFLGSVDDIRSFLSELDVFCLPSRWEGLPFALLEAMMAGKPCVAADVGDVGEALGEAGVLVPPEDPQALAGALGGLAESPLERRSLGSAAHHRARDRYTIERMIGSTVGVYEEIYPRP